MKTKTFDCVAMKQLGAQQIQEKTAGMTKEQILAFWQERSKALRERQKQIIKRYEKSTVTV